MTDQEQVAAPEARSLKFTVGRKLGLGIGISMGIFLLIGILSYRNIELMIENDKWTQHSQEVLNKVAQVMADMVDAETGQRGFVLTGEDKYLAPYEAAAVNIGKNIETVKTLTADNPAQQQIIGD